jgi:hypothetical protein
MKYFKKYIVKIEIKYNAWDYKTGDIITTVITSKHKIPYIYRECTNLQVQLEFLQVYIKVKRQ